MAQQRKWKTQVSLKLFNLDKRHTWANPWNKAKLRILDHLIVATLNCFSGRVLIFFSLVWSCGVYLAPLSAIYFSVISFFFNLMCFWSPFYSLKFVVHLASFVCSLVNGFCPRAFVGFLVGRTGAYTLTNGAESFPSDREGCTRWCILECLWA